MAEFTINGLPSVAAAIALTTEIEVQRAGQSGTEKDTLQHVYDLVATTFLGGDNTYTGREINSKASAASTPAILITGSWFSGGTAITTTPHFLINPTGATLPTTYPTTGTAFGINTPSGFLGNYFSCSQNGTIFFAVSATGNITCSAITASNVNAGTSNQFAWQARGILTSRAAGNVNLGAGDAALPVAQSLTTQGSRAGTDSNVSGANLTIDSGNGTGNSAGSTTTFRTPVATGSGFGAQTMTTSLTLKNGTSVLPTYTVAGVPSAATSGIGATICVSDEVGGAVLAFSDGTNWKRVTDRATIS